MHDGVVDLANKHSDKFYYVRINIDDNDGEKIAIQSNATNLPTFQIYQNGKMIKSAVNPAYDQLEQLFGPF